MFSKSPSVWFANVVHCGETLYRFLDGEKNLRHLLNAKSYYLQRNVFIVNNSFDFIYNPKWPVNLHMYNFYM